MTDDPTKSSPPPGGVAHYGLQPGHRLNSIVIDSELGIGGFGITYLARHAYLTNNWVACKEYFPTGAAVRKSNTTVQALSESHSALYAWGLQRFLDEARILSSFAHPNIVTVKDYFEENNTAYMVMEYIQGQNLNNYIDQHGVFGEEKLRRFISQLLDALEIVHRQGVLHRDITPSNILFRNDETPVLIDFGSARYAMRTYEFDQHSASSADPQLTTMFTRGYSPIEQYEQGGQGAWTDIYALGATLYFAAFGVRPPDALQRSGDFRTRNEDILVPAQKHGAGRLTEQLLQAIDAALNIYPEHRPESIGEWKGMLGFGETTVVRPRPSIETTRVDSALTQGTEKRSPRSKLPTVILASCVAILCGVIGYVEYKNRVADSLVDDALTILSENPMQHSSIDKAETLLERSLESKSNREDALRGIEVTSSLRKFHSALEEQQLNSAKIELTNLSDLLESVSMGDSLLPAATNALSCREAVLVVSRSLSSDPLAVQALQDSRKTVVDKCDSEPKIIDDMSATIDALVRLRTQLNAADKKNTFDSIEEQLKNIEKSLPKILQVDRLDKGRKTISNAEQAWIDNQKLKADVAAKTIEAAKAALLQNPIDVKAVERARKDYASIPSVNLRGGSAVAINDSFSAIIGLIKSLDSSVEALNSVDFSGNAPKLLNEAKSLDKLIEFESEYSSSVAERVEEKRRYLRQEIQMADFDTDVRAIFGTDDLSQSALQRLEELSAKILQSDSSNESARVVTEISQNFRKALERLGQEDIDGAKNLRSEIVSELNGNGYPHVLLSSLDKRTSEKVRAISERKRVDLLRQHADSARQEIQSTPLSQKSMEEVKSHYETISDMDPTNDEGIKGLAVVECLEQLIAVKNTPNFGRYEEVSETSNRCRQQLVDLDIDTAGLDDSLQRFEFQTRSYALEQLSRQPFNEAIWSFVERVYAHHSVDEGTRTSVHQCIDALRNTIRSLEESDFLEAEKSVETAERQMMPLFDDFTFEVARKVILSRKTNWSKTQLAEANTLLQSEPLKAENLKKVDSMYNAWLIQLNRLPWSNELANGLTETFSAMIESDYEKARRSNRQLMSYLIEKNLDDDGDFSPISNVTTIIDKRLLNPPDSQEENK